MNQLFLQDANSSIIERIIYFHDHAILVIIIIIVIILYIIIFILFNKFVNRFILENQIIEIIWTVIPIFFLIFLAVPSLKILYLTDEIKNPIFSVKVLGHQWYWRYEYNDFISINFDSFIIDSLSIDNFRLLDVDNRLILPIQCQIRLLISSLDVIHSFAIPSLGVKVDALPGRINQIMVNINRSGLFFGQCSEICGINHRFMPIVLEAVKLNKFLDWIKRYNN